MNPLIKRNITVGFNVPNTSKKCKYKHNKKIYVFRYLKIRKNIRNLYKKQSFADEYTSKLAITKLHKAR